MEFLKDYLYYRPKYANEYGFSVRRGGGDAYAIARAISSILLLLFLPKHTSIL